MPIYEYQCRKCKKVFDCVTLSISETCRPKCTHCSSSDVQKLVSRVKYVAGPREANLSQKAEQRMLKSLGGKVSDETKREIRKLSKEAGQRGKRRFESMMDTGTSENVEY